MGYDKDLMIWGKGVDCSIIEVLWKEIWAEKIPTSAPGMESPYKGSRGTPKQDQQFHPQSRETLQTSQREAPVESRNTQLPPPQQERHKRKVGAFMSFQNSSHSVTFILTMDTRKRSRKDEGWLSSAGRTALELHLKSKPPHFITTVTSHNSTFWSLNLSTY